MNRKSMITNMVLASGLLALAACSTEDSKQTMTPAPAPAPTAKAEVKAPAEKSPEKAKATKLVGDVGLLDSEKNYLIIVSKEGKLVTVDFDAKFQPTQKEYVNAKIADIGLGSAATVQYTVQGDKNIASNIEYLPAKGE